MKYASLTGEVEIKVSLLPDGESVILAIVLNLGLCFLNRIRCRNNRRILSTVGFFYGFGILSRMLCFFETVAFSVVVVSVAFSVVAISELSSDTETPTEVETVGDKELLFTFSPVVQAVNVPVAKINVSIIAIFFFILSPSFQKQVYPKNIKCPEIFSKYYIKANHSIIESV